MTYCCGGLYALAAWADGWTAMPHAMRQSQDKRKE